jgi:succinate-semialdehyde dehydrogenase/glutarate-semialdehyde dehydrogenase
VTTVLIPTTRTSQLIGHRVIRAVTLTGSVRAGSAVASESGKAIKKTVLELGGSDPFVVLEDVDVDAVAAAAAGARCINSGQSCIAAKRFIVLAGVADRFERALVRHMSELPVGDPMDRATKVGPLARQDLVDELHEQVMRSVQSGAELALGGTRMQRAGYFYPPTVLSGVRPGMAAFDEETFGPVAAVIRARDVGEAIQLANHTSFGLGASIWTADVERARELAGRIEAGNVFINGPVKSDPRLPFGGVKQSGYGRELGEAGIREFVNVKTVWVGRPAEGARRVPTERDAPTGGRRSC